MRSNNVVFISVLMMVALAGCAAQVSIAPVKLLRIENAKRIPGNYTAYVQEGGWDLDAKTQRWGCGAWTFETDLNEVYASSLKDALKENLQSVNFTENPIPHEKLRNLGYDRQIVVHQGNAEAEFQLTGGGFSTTAESNVRLTAIVAVIDPDGNVAQATITGHGRDSKPTISCAFEEPLAKASDLALRTVLYDIVEAIERNIKDH